MLLAFLFDDQREWSIAVSQQQHTTGDEKTFPRCPPDGGCQRWAPIERVCFLQVNRRPKKKALKIQVSDVCLLVLKKYAFAVRMFEREVVYAASGETHLPCRGLRFDSIRSIVE